MSLYTKQAGKGDPLCLLHGWALNSHVWDPLIEDLQQQHQLQLIDLPGHGRSEPPPTGDYSLENLAALIGKQLQTNTILAGWSLGGLIAIKIAAQFPHLVRKLILIASSPQFTNSSEWEHGVKKSVIEGFASDLIKNYRETINRFLAIQTLGSEQAKNVIRQLREKVFASGEPHIDSLSKGLDILKYSNLWKEAGEIQCPTLIVLGEKDSLIPKDSGLLTQQTIPDCELTIIKGAGHAPFISHKEEFLQTLKPFLEK